MFVCTAVYTTNGCLCVWLFTLRVGVCVYGCLHYEWVFVCMAVYTTSTAQGGVRVSVYMSRTRHSVNYNYNTSFISNSTELD